MTPRHGKEPLGLVQPSEQEPKSGCLYCPLFLFCAKFQKVADSYKRNAASILGKEALIDVKDGVRTARLEHTVRTHCVQEAWTPVDILFVGEAPGAAEDSPKKGVPFIGESGRTLRNTVQEVLVDEGFVKADKVGYTNTVRCRPPRDNDPSKTVVKCCAPELLREIAVRKPKLLVCLGNVSLEYLTGHTGIMTFAGSFVESTRIPGMKVLAALHPAYILRNPHLAQEWCDCIEQAGLYVTGKYAPKPGIGEYTVLTRAANVERVVASIRKARKLTAVDVETGSLSPFQKVFPGLLSVNFSNEEGKGYCVPWDHAESPFRSKGKIRDRVGDALRALMTDPRVPKTMHNGKFDVQHIRAALGCKVEGIGEDTMLRHVAVDETRGTHGLKSLAFRYTGMGGYDKPLDRYIGAHKEANPEKPGGSYANIPGDLLFPYGAADADCTLRIHREIGADREFKDPRLQILSKHLFRVLSEVLADMEYNGAQIDPKQVAVLDREYGAEEVRLAALIQEVPEVRAFVRDKIRSGKKKRDFEFNPGSTVQLQTVLFEYYGLRPTELTKAGFKRVVSRYASAVVRAKARQEPEPTFQAIVERAIKRKEWRLFATKADVLHEYERLDNPLAPLILDYRAVATLRGTFIAPLKEQLDEYERIHGTFLIHGTVTGRLSSAGPNLQNIPNKGGGRVKRVYISRFGDEGVLVQLDYSQIELRIAACWYNDAAMIESYVRGDDLHTRTAIDISGLSEEEFRALPKDEQKGWRTRAKRINFGILYGGGPPALQRTLQKDGVFITVEEAQEYIDRYFTVRPGLKKGMAKTEKFVKDHHYLRSLTGRKRRMPEIISSDKDVVNRVLRQAVNFPIQSGAADMTLMSLVLIHRMMEEEGYQSKVILTVHDSIVIDCHVDEFLEVASRAKHIMETLPQRSSEVLPGVDWNWLQVPIVADVEVGTTWGTLVGIDPDTVAADEPIPKEEPLFTEMDDGVVPREPRNIDELWELMARKDSN